MNPPTGKTNFIRNEQPSLRKDAGASAVSAGVSRPLYQNKYNLYGLQQQTDLALTKQKTAGDSRLPKMEFIMPVKDSKSFQQLDADPKATVARPDKSFGEPEAERPPSTANHYRANYLKKEQTRLLEEIHQRLAALDLTDGELQAQVSSKLSREIQTDSFDQRLHALESEIELHRRKVSSKKSEIASTVEDISRLENKLVTETL